VLKELTRLQDGGERRPAPTIHEIAEIMSAARPADINRYGLSMAAAMDEFTINTALRQAAFLAQVAHETGCLRWMVEDMNYSAERLLQVFPKSFDEKTAPFYAHQPMRIANHVYANRLGNGNEISGDGYRYRGRGLLHCTGREMYRKCGKALELPLEAQPDLLFEPGPACRSAGWIWAVDKQLNGHADVGDFELITRRISGGTHSLAERRAYYKTALEVLA
jgi:putative chitinase